MPLAVNCQGNRSLLFCAKAKAALYTLQILFTHFTRLALGLALAKSRQQHAGEDTQAGNHAHCRGDQAAYCQALAPDDPGATVDLPDSHDPKDEPDRRRQAEADAEDAPHQ